LPKLNIEKEQRLVAALQLKVFVSDLLKLQRPIVLLADRIRLAWGLPKLRIPEIVNTDSGRS